MKLTDVDTFLKVFFFIIPNGLAQGCRFQEKSDCATIQNYFQKNIDKPAFCHCRALSHFMHTEISPTTGPNSRCIVLHRFCLSFFVIYKVSTETPNPTSHIWFPALYFSPIRKRPPCWRCEGIGRCPQGQPTRAKHQPQRCGSFLGVCPRRNAFPFQP